MANRKSSITAELRLAGKAQFKTGLNEATRDAKVFGRNMDTIGGKGIGGLGRQFSGARSAIIGLTAATAGAAVGVKSVFDAASNQEQLMRGLAATSDGVRSVESQFERLRIKAMASGVSVNEMAQAFTQLRGAAISSEDAEKTAAAVANALNRVGRGADFGAVMTNLVQITSRTTGLGDEIKETANYLPQIRSLSKLKFGTDTGEGLNKAGVTGRQWVAGIVEELAKYEKATGGAKAATKSFSSAWEQFKATAGGVILEPLTKGIEKLTEGLEEVKRDAPLLLGDSAAPKEALSKAQLDEKKAKAAQELQKLEDARAEAVKETFAKELEIAESEKELAKAKASNDDAAILAATQELALLKEKMSVMVATNATDAEAVEFIRERIALEQKADRITRDADRAKQQREDADELSMLEARAGGMSERKLKKMEKAQRTSAEEQRLIAGGATPEQAKELAARKIGAEDRIAQDEERAAMGLRPRIRGAGRGGKNSKTGLGSEKYTGLITEETEFAGLDRYDNMQPDPEAIKAKRDAMRIGGAGRDKAKIAEREGNKETAGVAVWQQIVKGLQAVEKAVRDTDASKQERRKPLSTTSR